MCIEVAEVGADQRVATVGVRVAVRRDHADAGFLEHVRRQASDEGRTRVDVHEPILANSQRAHIPSAHPTAQLAAVFEVHRRARRAQAQSSREERPSIVLAGRRARAVAAAADSSELEEVGVVEEEVALLRKEEVEAGQVDLPVVHFGRRKVGVHRQRRVERRRHPIEGVERRLEVRLCSRRRVSPLLIARDRRHNVEAKALIQLREPGGKTHDAGVVAAIARHPDHFLAPASDRPAEVESPRVDGPVERDALERDLQLSGPAVLEYRRGGIPDGRPFTLKRVDRFVQCVVPHAVEIGLEAVATPPGIVRVEDHDQAIVGAQTLSVSRGLRHNPVRIAIEHSRAHVQGVVRIDQIDFGALDGAVPSPGRI